MLIKGFSIFIVSFIQSPPPSFLFFPWWSPDVYAPLQAIRDENGSFSLISPCEFYQSVFSWKGTTYHKGKLCLFPSTEWRLTLQKSSISFFSFLFCLNFVLPFFVCLSWVVAVIGKKSSILVLQKKVMLISGLSVVVLIIVIVIASMISNQVRGWLTKLNPVK